VSLVADYVIYSPLDPRFLEAVMKEAIEQTADQADAMDYFHEEWVYWYGKDMPNSVVGLYIWCLQQGARHKAE